VLENTPLLSPPNKKKAFAQTPVGKGKENINKILFGGVRRGKGQIYVKGSCSFMYILISVNPAHK
jgi:hypothetical protein